MKCLAYVGCYTDGRREGIHIFEADTETGAFRPVGVVGGVDDAKVLRLNRAKTVLYAGLALPEYGERGRNGAVAAYRVEGAALVPLGTRPTGVTPPCYIALDPAEQALVFAEYTNALAGAFALETDGGFAVGEPVTVKHTGSGPNTRRQERAHAHCAEVTPDGRYLCVADLGIDQVKGYDFAGRAAGLREVAAATIRCAGGAGPRHIAFHPGGRFAVVLNELDNTLASYRYTGESFVHVQTVAMLPGDFAGESTAAAVKFSADGRRAFASNRGHDSIVTYDVDVETGRLATVALSRLAGAGPRDFAFLPGEKFVMVGHERSGTVMTYGYDARTGTLSVAHDPFRLHRPVFFQFGKVW